MKIEKATTADVAEVAALWHEGWHQGHAAIVPEALVASRQMAEFTARTSAWADRTYVARREGALAGFYMLEDDEIYQFYVASTFQGQGVAAALMASAERALAGRQAWLACSVGNERAARFYEKTGWVRRGEQVYEVETAAGPMNVTVWRYEKDL